MKDNEELYRQLFAHPVEPRDSILPFTLKGLIIAFGSSVLFWAIVAIVIALLIKLGGIL